MNLIQTRVGNFYCPEDPGEATAGGNQRRSVTIAEAEALKQWARGQRVIEIGTGLGVSTRAMAETAESVVSVDVDSWCHQFEFPPNVVLTDHVPVGDFTFAFIDGDHHYEAVMKDIASVNAPLIALHDCDHPQVVQALVDSNLKVIEGLQTACKLTLCRRVPWPRK